MGAFVPGAKDALEVSTMARPTQKRHFGRAISFFLMATAQIFTQGMLALGRPIAHTPVTRK
jgi:hypothetical protein